MNLATVGHATVYLHDNSDLDPVDHATVGHAATDLATVDVATVGHATVYLHDNNDQDPVDVATMGHAATDLATVDLHGHSGSAWPQWMWLQWTMLQRIWPQWIYMATLDLATVDHATVDLHGHSISGKAGNEDYVCARKFKVAANFHFVTTKVGRRVSRNLAASANHSEDCVWLPCQC